MAVNVTEAIRESICLPEGTLHFEYGDKRLFDPNSTDFLILDVASGQQYFRLERTNGNEIEYYHSSPGTGTRVAKVSLCELPPADSAMITITWKPEEITLFVATKTPNVNIVSSEGILSERQYRISNDGAIVQIGDHGVKTSSYMIFSEGKSLLQTTAIESWRETLAAIDLLCTELPEREYQYESIISSFCIVMLTTGFEAYMKRRFLELEKEGIQPQLNDLIRAFYPAKEIDAGMPGIIEAEAIGAGISPLEHIVHRGTINFQSYKKCKLAFNKGYRLVFGSMDIDQSVHEQISEFIRYRHKIVHVSPTMGMLNIDKVPPDNPVFAKEHTVLRARQAFDTLITAVHSASLRLR